MTDLELFCAVLDVCGVARYQAYVDPDTHLVWGVNGAGHGWRVTFRNSSGTMGLCQWFMLEPDGSMRIAEISA